jgi:hypothetical protein
MDLAETIVALAALHAGIGLLVALAAVTLGAARLAPQGLTLGARAILLPGLGLLWPLVLGRWLSQ